MSRKVNLFLGIIIIIAVATPTTEAGGQPTLSRTNCGYFGHKCSGCCCLPKLSCKQYFPLLFLSVSINSSIIDFSDRLLAYITLWYFSTGKFWDNEWQKCYLLQPRFGQKLPHKIEWNSTATNTSRFALHQFWQKLQETMRPLYWWKSNRKMGKTMDFGRNRMR